MVLQGDAAAGAPSNMSVMRTSISLLLHQTPIQNEHMTNANKQRSTWKWSVVFLLLKLFSWVFLHITLSYKHVP